MAELIDLKETEERVLLFAVSLGENDDTEKSLDELEELVKTAGAVTAGRVIQNREKIHPATYLGKGKIDEVKELLWEYDATGVVCDDELSPIQLRNLEDKLETKVIDRTMVILDIFAGRARTREGKLQVELAQLRYRSSRLTGLGKSLSRLGGGIGTRGPGEKKLEMDRRLIRERISVLNRQLKELVQNRDTMRRQRSRNQMPTVAIVGYTNAGKSTLLNTLTEAEVLEEDMLFATLDPTTRERELENGQKILFTDTVGFISKLPHPLVQAFRSTLEEAKYADLILHVVDASNPEHDFQMAVVYETLKELAIEDKPVITAFNKIDRVSGDGGDSLKDLRSDACLTISAKEGTGLDRLIEKIETLLNEGFVRVERLIPYADAGQIQKIRQYGRLEKEDYREDGIYVEAEVPPFLAE